MARVSAAAADQKNEAAVETEHQVLYRKFRPRQFEDVVGQDHIIKPLQAMIANKKVGHAFLFVGPRGCGKTTTARLLAMAMNCENVSDTGEPCGTCRTCKGIITGSGAIGLHELDAASKRGVADMNALVDSMSMGSPARKKVYIVDECHMLTNEASNALLKTLEEPPADTLIILCTTEAQKVLPTIKSRAVSYNFKTVNADLMTSLVKEIVEATGMEIDEAGIAEVVRRGNGSPRDTLSALEGFGGDEAVATSDFVPKIAAAIADRNATDLVVSIAESINAGIGVPDLTRSLLEHWRNCLLSLQAPSALSLTEDDARRVSADAKMLKTNKVIRLLNVTSEALSKMSSSSDTRLLLETTLLQVALPETAESIDGIYDYLDDIMLEIKKLNKAVKNGVAVQASSEWPPVSDRDEKVADEVPEPVSKLDDAESDVDSHQEDAEGDPETEESDTDDDREADASDVEPDASHHDEADTDDSDYESYADEDSDGEKDYDDRDEDSNDARDDESDPETESDSYADYDDGDDSDAPVRDISALLGDEDDEREERDEPEAPVESDRDRKRRLRREQREREERGETEAPEEQEDEPIADVIPGDFHDDDDPNCGCTRCEDENAEHEQRAIREERERKEREAAEATKPTKLHLVKDEEPAKAEIKPARSKKKSDRVYSQDDCPTATDLVEIIEGDLVDRKTQRYLQPSVITETLRGDVLVLTVNPKSRIVPTDEIMDIVRDTVDNLWVSDIEFVL